MFLIQKLSKAKKWLKHFRFFSVLVEVREFKLSSRINRCEYASEIVQWKHFEVNDDDNDQARKGAVFPTTTDPSSLPAVKSIRLLYGSFYRRPHPSLSISEVWVQKRTQLTSSKPRKGYWNYFTSRKSDKRRRYLILLLVL